MENRKSRLETLYTPFECPVINIRPDKIYVNEPYEDNGKVLQRSVIQESDPRDFINKFTVADFALENVIAAGALDSLRPTSYETSQASLDNLISQIDNVSSQLPTSNEQD